MIDFLIYKRGRISDLFLYIINVFNCDFLYQQTL